MAVGHFKSGQFLDVDFDHQFIPTEKHDTTYSYKKAFGYFPGVASVRGHRDRYTRPVTNVNILDISHILYCLNRFHIHRHRGEARLPFRCNGMVRWSPFGRWSMERL